MTIEKQIELISKLKLSKNKKEVIRNKWTYEHELMVLHNYLGIINIPIDDLSKQINHSINSIRLKYLNIKYILKGGNDGLSHVSKLTIDVIKENIK